MAFKGKRKGKKTGKVSKAVKTYIAKKMDNAIEDKHFIAQVDDQVLNNTTKGRLHYLTMPIHGLAFEERLGARIKVKYIRFMLEARSSGAMDIINGAVKPQWFRVLMVTDKHTDATIATLQATNQGIFETTLGSSNFAAALTNPLTCNLKGDSNKNKYYDILYDKSKKLQMFYNGGVDAGATQGDTQIYKFTKHYPKGLHVNFTYSTTGAVTGVIDRAWYIVCGIGSPADDVWSYSYSFQYDICYEDA